MADIIITTHWTDGDVVPFIRIGESLHKQGHQVTIFTHCYYEDRITSLGLDFVPWDTWDEYKAMNEQMLGNIDHTGDFESIQKYRRRFESNEVRLREYQKIISRCGRSTVIIAKNRSSIAAYLAAEKLEIPLLLVWMAPYELASMKNFEELFGETVLDEFNSLRGRAGLPPVKSWLGWMGSPKMQIALWPEWYDTEYKNNWPQQITEVGFPLPDIVLECSTGKAACMEPVIQDDGQYVVVTGGTSKLIHPDFYKIAVEACGLYGKPAIVLTRFRELLPVKLPPNVKWYEYLPLDDLLLHTSIILHHGGIGTCCGALRAGVPQVILACYVDRPDNAVKLKTIGVADYIPPGRWNTDRILSAMEKMQSKEAGSACKLYAGKMCGCSVFGQIGELIRRMETNRGDYIINPSPPAAV